MPRLGSSWIVALLLAGHLLIDGTVGCEVLSPASSLCPEITYTTTTTDVKAGDRLVQAALDKMSRDGLESAGAACFQALRNTLCLQTYRKCNVEKPLEVIPVCLSVKDNAVSVCTSGAVFADTQLIDTNTEDGVFTQANSSVVCVSAAESPLDTAGKIIPDGAVVNGSMVDASAPECRREDLEPVYDDRCATNHTRTLVYKTKSGQPCRDTQGLMSTSYPALCGCDAASLVRYATPCYEDKTRFKISYQPADLNRTTPCDRRLGVPAPTVETCSTGVAEATDILFEGMSAKDFITRTGCASTACIKENGAMRTLCILPKATCSGWNATGGLAWVNATGKDQTAYLELSVSSPLHAVRPSILFQFNVTATEAGRSGLRILLDGKEYAGVMWDQLSVVGYEIGLEVGKVQRVRWEWVGDGGEGRANIWGVVLRDTYAYSDATLAEDGRPETMGLRAADEEAAVKAAEAVPTPTPSDVMVVDAFGMPVPSATEAVASRRVGHTDVPPPMSRSTSLGPVVTADASKFTSAMNGGDDAATVDEVAVSRHSTLGIVGSLSFVLVGIVVSGVYLWRKRQEERVAGDLGVEERMEMAHFELGDEDDESGSESEEEEGASALYHDANEEDMSGPYHDAKEDESGDRLIVHPREYGHEEVDLDKIEVA